MTTQSGLEIYLELPEFEVPEMWALPCTPALTETSYSEWIDRTAGRLVNDAVFRFKSGKAILNDAARGIHHIMVTGDLSLTEGFNPGDGSGFLNP